MGDPWADFRVTPAAPPPAPATSTAASAPADPWAEFKAAVPAASQPATSPALGDDGKPIPHIEIRPRAHEAEPPDAMTSLGRGAVAGATANFGDEIAGLRAAAASGLPPEVAQRQGYVIPAILGAARLGYEAIAPHVGLPSTGENVEQDYEKARDQNRADLAAAKAAHPGATLAGEFGGAVAIPVGVTARAATLPARMLAGAATGAAYGGASGAGEGTDAADRITKGVAGAGAGLAAGALAPPVASAAGAVIGRVANPVIQTVRGLANPEAEAGRRVATAIDRDRAIGSAGLTPTEFSTAQSAGSPVANIDLGGETTRAVARSAANTSPEGRAALQRLADDRFEGQSNRASTFLNNLVGGAPDNEAARDAIRSTAARVNRPAYAQAYRDGSQGLWSPELERLTSSPDVVAAMSDAASKGKSRAVADGFGGFNPGVTVQNGLVSFKRGATGVPTYPDLQFWDYTKRAIDDASGAARRAGRNSEAGVLTNLSATLRGELDRLVPSYANARAGAAAFFGAENAMDAGAQFVRSGMTAAEGARGLAKMSPAERVMFRQGFVATLINHINNSRDRVNVLNQIGSSPEARRKLAIALGPSGYRNVDAFLTVEHAMDRLRGALGNSTTARQLAEIGLAGGVGYGLGDSKGATAGALAAFLTRRAGARIDERVAQRVAEMLVSNDPTVLIRGVRSVAANQRILGALRSIGDRVVPRISGQQGTGIAPIQAGAVSRADDNQ